MVLCPKLNTTLQQREHHHSRILIESFHLSGHTFRLHWTVQDLDIWFWADLPLAVKGF